MSDPVKRSDWRSISPLPADHGWLPVELSFTSAEFAKIQHGRLPRVQGDKWFIFFEEPWLYLHRAMTGDCMFQVRIETDGDGYRVRSALVDRDCSKTKGSEREELTHWLYALLLWEAGRESEAREHSQRLTELLREYHERDNKPLRWKTAADFFHKIRRWFGRGTGTFGA